MTTKSLPICTFILPSKDIITYSFDPSLRDEDGDGIVTLERISRPAEPADIKKILPAEPRPGHEFFGYPAEDGGEVRYQYDPGSRNGKDYVAAVHREPNNWMRLKREKLGVKKGWLETQPFAMAAQNAAQTASDQQTMGKEEKRQARRDSAFGNPNPTAT